MSSVGGDPESALFAFNMLSALPVKISAYNVGQVASAAITVFLAASERYGTPGSSMAFHQTSWNYDGRRLTEDALSERVSFVKIEDQRTANIIAQKTANPVQRVYDWQSAEAVMDTATAKQSGLILEERVLAVPKNGWIMQVTV